MGGGRGAGPKTGAGKPKKGAPTSEWNEWKRNIAAALGEAPRGIPPPGADGRVRQPTAVGAKARRKALQARMQPDEYAMTVGIVNIMVTSFVVGRAPESFFIVHLIKTAVLLPLARCACPRRGRTASCSRTHAAR